MFTVSFADKNCFIPRTKYLEQPRQTKKEEQMSTVQGWKKEYTGVQGWVEEVVEEGGAGWIWVPPTPPQILTRQASEAGCPSQLILRCN